MSAALRAVMAIMMATPQPAGITYIGAGAVQSGSSPTVPVPAGYQAGDLLVIAASAGVGPPSAPSGWSQQIIASTGGARMVVFTKVAGVSESSVALSGGTSSSNAVMLCYRGTNATTPVDAASTVVASTSGTSVATNTLTTATANELVLSVYATSPTAATLTAPGSTNQRVLVNPGAAGCGLLVVDEIQAAAGPSTARTATASTSITWSCGSVAFKT